MPRDCTREAPPGLVIRPLTEADLDAADRVNRLAFGTFFGLEDPMTFRGDSGLIHCRFRADPEGGLAAEIDGLLVASAQLMNWGSVGIIGPVSVDVAYWRRGIGHALMPPVMEILGRRGHAFTGLFTHPQSPLHVRLYEELGYSMQHMTGVMAKDVAATPMPHDTALFSMLTGAEKADALERDAFRLDHSLHF
jgi:predicted N-acetyltransferase YhbS